MKDITTCANDNDNDNEDGARVIVIYHNSIFDNGCGITNNIMKAAQNIMSVTKTVDEAGGQC